MGALGRDAALGRHPRVAERMGSAEVRELELLGEHLGKTDILVDLDHAARAHHPKIISCTSHARLRIAGVAGHDDHRMARTHGIDLAPDPARDLLPVLTRRGE